MFCQWKKYIMTNFEVKHVTGVTGKRTCNKHTTAVMMSFVHGFKFKQ